MQLELSECLLRVWFNTIICQKLSLCFKKSCITSCKVEIKEFFRVLALAFYPHSEEAGLLPSSNLIYVDAFASLA